jgi:hypothetical protein
MVGITRVQLSQWEYFFLLLVPIPRDYVHSIFSIHFATATQLGGFGVVNTFCHRPFNGSPPFHPSSPP